MSNSVTIDHETNEAVGPAEINTTGSLTQANGVRHLVCGTTMNFVVVSDRAAALRCPRCGLRVVFPAMIKTLDGLAAHFG